MLGFKLQIQHFTLVIERYLKLKSNITALHFYTNQVYNVRIKVKGCDIMDTFEKILNIIKENKGIVSTAENCKAWYRQKISFPNDSKKDN